MKSINKYITLVLILLTVALSANAEGKRYDASLFGIKSNGETLNTTAIQKAIDYISAQGGGTLVFSVGRYVTGTVFLKDNVDIVLGSGAIIVGSTNPYDYVQDPEYGTPAVVMGYNVKNVSITGRGVIDGRGREVAYNYLEQAHLGFIKDNLSYDRTSTRPSAVLMVGVKGLKVEGITIKNAAFWTFRLEKCEDVVLNKITIDSKAYWNNDGIDIGDCKNLTLTNSFVDDTDDGICLKSHRKDRRNENIYIYNNVVRSSASGIKFGTWSTGGYKGVKIVKNTVYDTHRSAITIASPNGGIAEDILIDSLYAYNVGNAIYLRVNNRFGGDTGAVRNVTIRNMYCELTAGKPDKGYDYEGPVEDLPRNLSPSAICGIPGRSVENINLENITIVYPGGANPHYAKVGLSPKELDAIPEMVTSYPEFSQFKELPAWGFYIRHAKGINFKNVTIKSLDKDFRAAVVCDDLHDSDLSGLIIEESGNKRPTVHLYKSTNVKK